MSTSNADQDLNLLLREYLDLYAQYDSRVRQIQDLQVQIRNLKKNTTDTAHEEIECLDTQIEQLEVEMRTLQIDLATFEANHVIDGHLLEVEVKDAYAKCLKSSTDWHTRQTELNKDEIKQEYKAHCVQSKQIHDYFWMVTRAHVYFLALRGNRLREEQAKARLNQPPFVGEKYTQCKRCSGHGITGFAHVDNGICFACRGAGNVKTDAYLAYLGQDQLPF